MVPRNRTSRHRVRTRKVATATNVPTTVNSYMLAHGTRPAARPRSSSPTPWKARPSVVVAIAIPTALRCGTTAAGAATTVVPPASRAPPPSVAAPADVVPHRRAVGIAMATTTLGLAFHGVGLLLRGLAAGRVPWANMYEFTVVGTFVAVATFVVLTRWRDVRFLGTIVVGLVVVALGHYVEDRQPQAEGHHDQADDDGPQEPHVAPTGQDHEGRHRDERADHGELVHVGPRHPPGGQAAQQQPDPVEGQAQRGRCHRDPDRPAVRDDVGRGRDHGGPAGLPRPAAVARGRLARGRLARVGR